MSIIILIILIILFLVISLYIKRLLNNKQDNSPIIVRLTEGEAQEISCSSIKTSCSTQDPNACSQCSEQMICVDLDNKNPKGGKQINGGGSVCVPNLPTNSCKRELGGIYTWNGFAFSENQTWGCTCLWPNVFTGDDCSQVSPGFCTGGIVDLTTMDGNTIPSSDICKCPSGTLKMIRGNDNTPFCAPINLAGTIYPSPDWRNVISRPVNSAGTVTDLHSWSKAIAQEISPSLPLIDDCSKQSFNCNIEEYLQQQESINNTPIINYLDNKNPLNMADRICEIACTQISSNGMCDCSVKKAVNFPKSEITAQYTYYGGDYI